MNKGRFISDNNAGGRVLVKKIIIGILIAGVIGGGAWYYFSRVHHVPIQKVLSNPRAYQEKPVTVEGEVTDRTSFFGLVRFFKLKDKTGEIIVVTKQTLPETKSAVIVKGRPDEAFVVGDLKLVVFVAESIEQTGTGK